MAQWNKEHTRQYSICLIREEPLNKALEKAADYENVTCVRYIKMALIEKLQKEGFLTEPVELHGPGGRPKHY